MIIQMLFFYIVPRTFPVVIPDNLKLDSFHAKPLSPDQSLSCVHLTSYLPSSVLFKQKSFYSFLFFLPERFMYRSSVAWRSVSLCWKLHHSLHPLSPRSLLLVLARALASKPEHVQRMWGSVPLCRWRIPCFCLQLAPRNLLGKVAAAHPNHLAPGENSEMTIYNILNWKSRGPPDSDFELEALRPSCPLAAQC